MINIDSKIEMRFFITVISAFAVCVGLTGCSGYSNESLYPKKVSSVYVEMFDNRSFWRGVDYKLTDALAKRIEAQTPYKVVSSRDRADSIINGQIVSIDQAGLSTERQTGRLLEKEVLLEAVVSWKDLKTGELLMNNQTVNASASYSEWQSQGFDYASALAANKLAQQIVEQMEVGW
jgi:hypothetical protein